VTKVSKTIAQVVRGGLCIGCGLCEAVTKGRISMQPTALGSLRPRPADGFTPEEEAALLASCPGVIVEPRVESDTTMDEIWGSYRDMRYAWAGDPEIRFRGSTGGVLTALGAHLIRQKKVQSILHVRPDPAHPLRNQWTLSRSVREVIQAAGSRYAPVAPLAGLGAVLDLGEPFAIIAKPCDLSAVHRFGRLDDRVGKLCVARLTMVCGGQSRLKKSLDMLTEFGVPEPQVSVFRYRGYGNPGPTRIETHDGRVFEKTYREVWGGDEQTWELETRCKLCPDALGEAADVAAADVWPGGTPTGEDAGINGIVVRTGNGQALVHSAVAQGDLVLGDPISARRFDAFQPHQVAKKEALAARFEALQKVGHPVIDAKDLRLEALAARRGPDHWAAEYRGTLERVRSGRFDEPLPVGS
jgi:coenzyme F420 hydrogenase subunit beta